MDSSQLSFIVSTNSIDYRAGLVCKTKAGFSEDFTGKNGSPDQYTGKGYC
jgi:hypothetical protein